MLECLSKSKNQKLLTMSNIPCSRAPLAIYTGKLSLSIDRQYNKGTETIFTSVNEKSPSSKNLHDCTHLKYHWCPEKKKTLLVTFNLNTCIQLWFFLNWDSLHLKRNNHFDTWNYKKLKHKNIKAYKVSV